jgi:5'-phosphate synthase pdxT subunit
VAGSEAAAPEAPPRLPRIGVLAVQGDFQAHLEVLRGRADAWPVRTVPDLRRDGGVEGLVLPGGESTTMIRLLRLSGLWDELLALGRGGIPLFGTCAGAILLAREVEGVPEGASPATGPGTPGGQASLGLLDARIRRNAYGRQVDSFETTVDAPLLPGGPLPVVCIRAPRFLSVGAGVEVLAALDGAPIWVRQGPIWAATFHPELSGDPRVHEAFVLQVSQATRR